MYIKYTIAYIFFWIYWLLITDVKERNKYTHIKCVLPLSDTPTAKHQMSYGSQLFIQQYTSNQQQYAW